MTEAPKEIILLPDEKVVTQIEGNAFTDSPNPLVRFFTLFVKFFYFIFGVRMKTMLLLTNKRLVKLNRTRIFWVINRDVEVITYGKESLTSFGYYQARRWLFFKTLYFTFWETLYMARITYKGSLQDLNNFIMKLTEYVHGK